MYSLLLWVVMYNLMDEHIHGRLHAHEVAFGTTPDIIHFIYSKLWNPVYYPDSEEKFPSMMEQLGHWLVPTYHCRCDLTYWILT